jgi:hypothetical protein
MLAWLIAFGLTIGCELLLVAAVAPRGLRTRAGFDSLFANLLTHPLAWLAIRGAGWSWTAVELSVLAVEAGVYRGVTRLGWGRATLCSLVANGVTAGLSFVVRL